MDETESTDSHGKEDSSLQHTDKLKDDTDSQIPRDISVDVAVPENENENSISNMKECSENSSSETAHNDSTSMLQPECANDLHSDLIDKTESPLISTRTNPTNSVCIDTVDPPPSSTIQETGPTELSSQRSSLPDIIDCEADDDIDCSVDDALDEGCMDMEGTLERGFSLQENSQTIDERSVKYKGLKIDYQHESSCAKRYGPTLKHLIPIRTDKCEPGEMPVDSTGMVSYTMFSWMTSLMWRAYKHGLTQDDVPLCSKYDMCGYNAQRLELLWDAEVKSKGTNASLHRVAWQFIKTRVYFGLLLFIITLTLGFLGPTVFMRNLIDWLDSDGSVNTGLCWVLGLIITEFLRILTFGLVWAVNYRTGVRLRSACLGLVYKKLMRLSTLGDKSVGEMINLFANDGQRIFDFVVLGVLIVGGPVVGVGGVIYILLLLGPHALLGMLAFLLFYPVQYGISRLTGALRRRTVVITDERVGLMSELLACIKLIKMCAWEDNFQQAIQDVRARERVLLERSAYVQSTSLALAPTVPVIAAIVTFVAHTAAGHDLTPAQVFPLLTLMTGVVRVGLSYTVHCHVLWEAVTAIIRLQSVLELPELEDYIGRPQQEGVTISIDRATLAWPTASSTKKKKHAKQKGGGLSPADQMLLGAAKEKWTPVLCDISLTIKKGELVGVCGSVGAGKSSLLYALLGQMRLVEQDKSQVASTNSSSNQHKDGGGPGGSVAVDGDVAYVSQQAWILNTTIRENILMGDKFDALRYYRVVYACSLTQDLDNLPAGDQTEVGERGVTLSGGQKQRLSLARALYSNKSVYLLDDPLSAVDGEVGSHIFRWAIKTGLRHATVVLVTHQLQYLPQCSRVVLLQRGRVLETGSHNSLMREGGDYAALYAAHTSTLSGGVPGAQRKRTKSSSADYVPVRWQRERTLSCASSGSAAYNGSVALTGEAAVDQTSPTSTDGATDPSATVLIEDGFYPPPTDGALEAGVAATRTTSLSLEEEEEEEGTAMLETLTTKDGKKTPVVRKSLGGLVSEERAHTGNVSSDTYLCYIRAAGGLVVAAVVVICFGINVGSTAFSSWWLSHWLSVGTVNVSTTLANNETVFIDSVSSHPDLRFYQTVYGSTVFIILATSLGRGVIFMKASIHASTRLHQRVLRAVMRSPLSFFDCTPVGRILNIFSRDMDEVDVRLPMSMEMFLQNVWLISCSLVIVCLVFWQFLPLLLFLACLFMLIRNVFRIGIRDFKRLENVSRSPLYSHVSATLAGLSTIHAYGKQTLFEDQFLMLFDESSTAFYLFNCAMRWLAIRLDILALAVTACTALLTVALRGGVEAAFAGLALAYASQLSGIFQYTVRLSTETEARFTSVERIHSYIKWLPSEGSTGEAPPPALWPQHGRICFRKVAMRYRHDSPLVFKELSFDIHEQEKIGVVGRTGSGKSSLAACLFRLVEIAEGVIRIDGTDISKISLHQLRSKLSVIPQDPVLFSGTIRYNLDPLASHGDDAVWAALEKVQLKSCISALREGLDFRVAENGDNFSVGERQLLCMARALLRDSKIVLLDEATANIDTESDAVIQRALQTAFAHCTLISIAHRVNTILWCDRVMVMNDGQLMQFDSPKNLIKQTDSPFAKMVATAGRAAEQFGGKAM